MSRTKPEFHLQRVNVDGSTEPPEIYSLLDPPSHLVTDRRGFLGASVAVGSILSLMAGCQSQSENAVPVPSPVPVPRVTPPPPPERKTPSNSTNETKGTPATTVYAHTASIRALAITPDNKILASGSADNTLKLWSLSDGQLLKTLDGHHNHVNALSVAPDGRTLVSGSNDNTLKLWSLPDGQLLKTLEGHREEVNAVAITPNGRTLVSGSGSFDKALKLWSLPEGQLIKTLEGEYAPVLAVSITPDGRILAVGFLNDKVQLLSMPDGHLLEVLKGHHNGVNALSVTPDGRILVSGSADKTLKLWSLPDGEFLKTLENRGMYVSALSMTPDGRILASGSGPALGLGGASTDYSVKLWSLPNGELLKTLEGHRNEVGALASSPDGKTLASGDADGVIMLWDLETLKQTAYLFDPKASKTDAFVYNVKDEATGRILTYTLPCGSPIPAGAVCTCNCVPGTYRPPSSGAGGFIGGGTFCSCNKICTCIPVCQAHRLLHHDAVVRTLAEELLLVMGEQEFGYMTWAARRAEPTLAERIGQLMNAICCGSHADPSRWPTMRACLARLNDPDKVVAIMAAQMLHLRQERCEWRSETGLQARVEQLLNEAMLQSWYLRADADTN